MFTEKKTIVRTPKGLVTALQIAVCQLRSSKAVDAASSSDGRSAKRISNVCRWSLPWIRRQPRHWSWLKTHANSHHTVQTLTDGSQHLVLNTGHPPYLTDLLQYYNSARSTCSSAGDLLSVLWHNFSIGAFCVAVSKKMELFTSSHLPIPNILFLQTSS